MTFSLFRDYKATTFAKAKIAREASNSATDDDFVEMF